MRERAFEQRVYQLAVAGEAIKRNTLVVLPTALGKTVIASLVASHFLYNYSNMKVLVMAPTRPLVLQHRDTFMRFLKLRPQDVQVLTGKYAPSYRLHAWKGSARIYFATPQVVQNDCRLGLKLRNFSLLVFDECHRARKNYAYTRVAEAYLNEAPYPIILGLTASPRADRKKIVELCKALHIEHVETRTEEDPDVRPYISPIAMDWKLVRLPESYRKPREILRGMLEERLQKLSSIGVIKKDPKYVFRTDLLKLGDELRYRIEETPLEEERRRLYSIVALQSTALTLFHALELLESQGAYALKCFLERVKQSEKLSHRAIASGLTFRRVYEILDSLEEHPKVNALERILLGQLSGKPSSNIIVFTQYRDTSSHLVSRLSEVGISSARFIGQADRAGDTGMSQERQAFLLEKFRKGELKVLVATSIGEEGLDVPSVDLVVFYEPVPSEIRYIQRKGRTGRRRFGRVVILATEGTLDVSYLRASTKMAERMKSLVKSLNFELEPIARFGPAPKESPMSMEVISEAEEYAPIEGRAPEVSIELELESLEKERLKWFNREVKEVAKLILMRTLRAGREGVPVAELSAELEAEGISPGAVGAALDRLHDEDQVRRVGERIYPAEVEVARHRPREIHTFEVERILPGKAILSVDDKWHLVLMPNEYDGPRQLIKKGSRFKAAAKLYKLEGKLHARIYAVKEAIE
ncbi:MAG: helicase-related protein [Candidatus Hodarchaeaceae archaeon]|nr:helicase-related protein [Candidatus Hodarchaeaceae archaeon]